MIPVQELRIGNWYNLKNIVNGEISPYQFTNYADYLDFGYYGEPIPLSQDILEKCGFEWGKNINIYKLKIDEDELEYNWGQFGEFTWNGMFIPSHPKYLHQLQNLYSALTNKELVINL